MLNIEILNDLNNWNYTLKMKLPAGGGMSLIFITESFIQLIRSNGWFIQEWSKWLFMNG